MFTNQWSSNEATTKVDANETGRNLMIAGSGDDALNLNVMAAEVAVESATDPFGMVYDNMDVNCFGVQLPIDDCS